MASVSQSVSRCFEIFSLFSERQTALTAAEIAEYLGAPRSSVAALLKELVELRMVSLNRRTLTYLPTLGFANLGTWLADPAHFPRHIGELMEALQRDCGETVTASWPLDKEMEIVRVEKSRQPISFIAEISQRLPLWDSAAGTAYLASLSNAQISARWEKDSRRLPSIPALSDVLERCAQTRQDQLCVVHAGVFEGASAIAAIADCEHDGRPLVISIAGPEGRMRANEQRYREMLLGVMATFGVVPSGPPA